jgi:hypothetical protein
MFPEPGFAKDSVDLILYILHTFFYVLAGILSVWLLNLLKYFRPNHVLKIVLLLVQLITILFVGVSYYYSLQLEPPFWIQLTWLTLAFAFFGFAGVGFTYYGYMSIRDKQSLNNLLGFLSGFPAQVNGLFVLLVGTIFSAGTLFIAFHFHPIIFGIILVIEMICLVCMHLLDTSQRKKLRSKK